MNYLEGSSRIASKRRHERDMADDYARGKVKRKRLGSSFLGVSEFGASSPLYANKRFLAWLAESDAELRSMLN